MFNFGRNWKNYVKNVVNEQVINEAKNSLLKYVPEDDINFFRDKTFVDIGCGSGLFSISAILLGCRSVISFDIQEESLEATSILRERFINLLPDRVDWQVFRGNILDQKLVSSYANKGDIVYSWGVLHHTGNMWKAIENTTKFVKKGGHLIIAIYNHAPSSRYWLKIKEFYNKHEYLQSLLNVIYGSYVCFGYVLRRRKFELYRERGMHVFYDAIDWLGGYPYEYACFDEVVEFVNNLGLELIKAPTKLPCGKDVHFSNIIKKLFSILRTANTGCNEFVFKRSD